MAKKRRGKRKSKSQHRRSEFRDSVESFDEQELVEGEKKEPEKNRKPEK